MQHILKKQLTQLLCLITLFFGLFEVFANENLVDAKLANEYFSAGKYPEAIKAWELSLKQYKKDNNWVGQAKVLQKIANTYQALGESAMAIELLHAAVDGARESGDKILQTYIAANLASVLMGQGDIKLAHKLFEQSVLQANNLGDGKLRAALLNDFGGLLIKEELFDAAKKQFYESRAISKKLKLIDQEKKVLINLAIVSALTKEHLSFFYYIKSVNELFRYTKFDLKNAKYALRLSELLQTTSDTESEMRKRQFAMSYELLAKASRYLKSIGAKRELATANGLLAELYLKTGNLSSVEIFYQRAIFLAQQSNANDLLYHWQWQYARYLNVHGDKDMAVEAYRKARFYYKNLNPLFTWTNVNPNTDDDTPSVFHYELADLLLKQSSSVSNKKKQYSILSEARDTIEGLKSAELQDYFKDSCVVRAKNKVSNIGLDIEDDTVTVYPILFKDRLEVLVSHKKTIQRFTSKVAKNDVKNLIVEFREKLEKRHSRDYLPVAKQFYNWVIKPMNEMLVEQNIKTMVLIPDVSMRALPFAALHNGNKFLIEEYALAVSPGLELTNREHIDRSNISVLMAGLSESVSGLPALTHVRKELANINNIYPGKMLLNKKFSQLSLKTQLRGKQFNVAHIASHGNFSGVASQSYLVTYDGKVTVNDLSRSIGASQFRSQPIELLTLSACYTAAGDDKAALGLAGITIKAGARSALATLWPINDVATAEIMKEFYTQLKDGSLNKAEVLRKAQLHMLKDKRYRHPGYWSPFLMIGNWL